MRLLLSVSRLRISSHLILKRAWPCLAAVLVLEEVVVPMANNISSTIPIDIAILTSKRV